MVPSAFVRQECLRSTGLLAIALVGWSVIAVTGDAFARPASAVGLLVLSTWLALTVGCVALRLATGRGLFPWQPDGLYVLVAIVTGFVAAHEVFVTGRSTTVFLWYGLAVVGGAVLVRSRTARAVHG